MTDNESLRREIAGLRLERAEQLVRRIAALDAGTVQPVPWEEAEAMIFGNQDDALRGRA